MQNVKRLATMQSVIQKKDNSKKVFKVKSGGYYSTAKIKKIGVFKNVFLDGKKRAQESYL